MPNTTPFPTDGPAQPASVERLRQSVAQIIRVQQTAPVGWALVALLAWDRAPTSVVAWWALGFGVALVGILAGLRHVQRSGMGVQACEARLKLLALVDGLAWGPCPGR